MASDDPSPKNLGSAQKPARLVPDASLPPGSEESLSIAPRKRKGRHHDYERELKRAWEKFDAIVNTPLPEDPSEREKILDEIDHKSQKVIECQKKLGIEGPPSRLPPGSETSNESPRSKRPAFEPSFEERVIIKSEFTDDPLPLPRPALKGTARVHFEENPFMAPPPPRPPPPRVANPNAEEGYTFFGTRAAEKRERLALPSQDQTTPQPLKKSLKPARPSVMNETPISASSDPAGAPPQAAPSDPGDAPPQAAPSGPGDAPPQAAPSGHKSPLIHEEPASSPGDNGGDSPHSSPPPSDSEEVENPKFQIQDFFPRTVGSWMIVKGDKHTEQKHLEKVWKHSQGIFVGGVISGANPAFIKTVHALAGTLTLLDDDVEGLSASSVVASMSSMETGVSSMALGHEKRKEKSTKATAKLRKANPITIDNRMNYQGLNIKVTSCTQRNMHNYFIPHHHVMRPGLFLVLKLRLKGCSPIQFLNSPLMTARSWILGEPFLVDPCFSEFVDQKIQDPGEKVIPQPLIPAYYEEAVKAINSGPKLDAIDWAPQGTSKKFPFSTLPAFSETALHAASSSEPLRLILEKFQKTAPGDYWQSDCLIVAALTWKWFKQMGAETKENLRNISELPADGFDAGNFIGYFEYLLSRTEYHGLAFHPHPARFASDQALADHIYSRPVFKGFINEDDLQEILKEIDVTPVCSYLPCDLISSDIQKFSPLELSMTRPFKGPHGRTHDVSVYKTVKFIGDVRSLGLSTYARDPKALVQKRVLISGHHRPWHDYKPSRAKGVLELVQKFSGNTIISYPAWDNNFFVIDCHLNHDMLSDKARTEFNNTVGLIYVRQIKRRYVDCCGVSLHFRMHWEPLINGFKNKWIKIENKKRRSANNKKPINSEDKEMEPGTKAGFTRMRRGFKCFFYTPRRTPKGLVNALLPSLVKRNQANEWSFDQPSEMLKSASQALSLFPLPAQIAAPYLNLSNLFAKSLHNIHDRIADRGVSYEFDEKTLTVVPVQDYNLMKHTKSFDLVPRHLIDKFLNQVGAIKDQEFK